jgi:hypothetical protein
MGRSKWPPSQHLGVGGGRIRRGPTQIWRLRYKVDFVGVGLTLGGRRRRRVQEEGIPRAWAGARLGRGRDRRADGLVRLGAAEDAFRPPAGGRPWAEGTTWVGT